MKTRVNITSFRFDSNYKCPFAIREYPRIAKYALIVKKYYQQYFK